MDGNDRQRERTEKVTVRLRPRERRAIEAAADRRGVYLSEMIREAALEAARAGDPAGAST